MASPTQRVDKIFFFILFASFVCMLADTKDFAPAGATKGRSDRPLEAFGPIRYGFFTSQEA